MSVVGAFIVPHPPIIIPEVGQGEEQKIIDTIKSYQEVARRIAKLRPDTIVITTPHSILYSDYFHISPGNNASGNLSRFGAKNISVNVKYDNEFVCALAISATDAGLKAGTEGEKDAFLDHGTIIPLYFINQYLKEYKVIRVGLSGQSLINHYRLGRCIAETADALSRRVVFVASGDLSHTLKEDGPYGYTPEGVLFDSEITQAMKEGDFLRFLEFSPDLVDVAAECGLRSFVIMAGSLSGKEVKPEFLSYEGPFGVGYAVCSYDIIGKNEDRHFDKIYNKKQLEHLMERKAKEDTYVRLARLSLETYIKTGEQAKLPEDLPEELLGMQAGVFVSLKMYGDLRGCIGTISPATGCIAKEIRQNAVSAGTEDPRFSPIREEELSKLVYSVDVLTDPEPINTVEELDVKRYGVIVTSRRKRGLLLPNLEGIDTPEKQVCIAMQKAGILKNEEYSLERFEVVRHK